MSETTALLLYLVFAAGGAGVYFMMPRSEHSTGVVGAIFGVAALLGLLALIGVHQAESAGVSAYFYLFSTIALVGAARVITHPRPVYSAIYFVLVVIAVAALLVLQEAEFLAVALVIIYAGAILVTYLFVIMLAQQPGSPVYDRRAREPLAAVVAGFVLMGAISGAVGDLPTSRAGQAAASGLIIPSDGNEVSPAEGSVILGQESNVAGIGAIVATKYVVALEIAGVLLLISMIGAIALSKKRVLSEVVHSPRPQLGQIGKEVEPF